MKSLLIIAAYAALCAGVIIYTAPASAEITGDIGASVVTYKDASTDIAYHGKVAHSSTPFYLAGRFEAPRIRMLGQPIAEADVLSAGLGVEVKVNKSLFLTLEGGYAMPDVSSNTEIRQEVIYTQLVNNHLNPNRPIPILEYPRYNTTYDVDGGPYARLALEYRWHSLALTASYRALRLDQEYTMRAWDEDLPALRQKYGDYADGYWREDTELDLSSVEIGITWKW